MKKCIPEDWQFAIEVLNVGPDNRPENCRLGFEPGDTFTCGYECPGGFCPEIMFQIFPVLELVRTGGDLRKLGGREEHGTMLTCPDGVVRYRISAERVVDPIAI